MNTRYNERSTEYSRRAGQTRSRRAPEYARQREVHKAMKLYSLDHAKAKRGECERPNMANYIVHENCRDYATEWAKSRFAELA